MAQTSTLSKFLFRKHALKLLLLLLFACLGGSSQAQQTIFFESFGENAVGSGAISEYQNNGYFDNPSLHFSGTALMDEWGDSYGYNEASGPNNIYFMPNEHLQISNINTLGYTNIALSV